MKDYSYPLPIEPTTIQLSLSINKDRLEKFLAFEMKALKCKILVSK